MSDTIKKYYEDLKKYYDGLEEISNHFSREHTLEELSETLIDITQEELPEFILLALEHMRALPKNSPQVSILLAKQDIKKKRDIYNKPKI